MIEPMERIGIHYENREMVKLLIECCGNRANFIAITCHEALKIVKDSLVTQENIEHVLCFSSLEDYLKGWEKISHDDEEENTLDRAILYLTLKLEKFRLEDVIELLENRGLEIDENKIDKSLERLVIGYFFTKDRGTYSYCVPLFKEKLLYESIDTKLKREIRRLLSYNSIKK